MKVRCRRRARSWHARVSLLLLPLFGAASASSCLADKNRTEVSASSAGVLTRGRRDPQRGPVLRTQEGQEAACLCNDEESCEASDSSYSYVQR
jgi:hypothetical protein